MKIDIWSDIACPYCYIGNQNLEYALEQFPYRDQVEIKYHSFELEPEIAADTNEDQHHAVMRKYRQSADAAQQTLDNATRAGSRAGLKIDFDKVITTNTHNAHRLIKLAAKTKKDAEVKDAIFKAYFTDGKHIGRKEVLIELAAKFDIDAAPLFEGSDFSDAVKDDEAFARTAGIRSVPYFLVDSKFSISGAQPIGSFLRALNEAWKTSEANAVEKNDAAPGCEGGACTI